MNKREKGPKKPSGNDFPRYEKIYQLAQNLHFGFGRMGQTTGQIRHTVTFACRNVFILDFFQRLKLPAVPNVVTVLEGYLKCFAVNVLCASPEKQRLQHHLRSQKQQTPDKRLSLVLLYFICALF